MLPAAQKTLRGQCQVPFQQLILRSDTQKNKRRAPGYCFRSNFSSCIVLKPSRENLDPQSIRETHLWDRGGASHCLATPRRSHTLLQRRKNVVANTGDSERERESNWRIHKHLREGQQAQGNRALIQERIMLNSYSFFKFSDSITQFHKAFYAKIMPAW